MSIVYRIDNEIGITNIVWDGEVTPAQFIAHTQRMLADPAWPPAGQMQLTDARTVTSERLFTTEVFEEAVALWGRRKDAIAGIRLAVIAESGYEKGRIFETRIAKYGVNVIVFNTLATACTWLGVDVVQTERVLSELRAEAKAGT